MNKINRRELAKAIHENAVAKGFWDEKHSPEHYLMLAICELSEAVEAWRKDKRADREAYDARTTNGFDAKVFEMYIKDTVADELADAYIRLLDLAEGFGWSTDKREYQEFVLLCKAIRDGFITDFMQSMLTAVGIVAGVSALESAASAIDVIEAVAEVNDIDLAWHIEEKMKYNATRPHLHGKKC